MEGNLLSLTERFSYFRPLLARQVLRQMLHALDYLSTRGYVHRDVKPDNIFWLPVPVGPATFQGRNKGNDNDNSWKLSASSALPFHFRLGDFGLCESESRIGPGETHGTLVYMAPELFSEHRRLRRPSHKSDVWALYVTVLWVLDLDGIW